MIMYINELCVSFLEDATAYVCLERQEHPLIYFTVLMRMASVFLGSNIRSTRLSCFLSKLLPPGARIPHSARHVSN